MLKKICGLFLGLVVCAGSACVTPTHASSAHQVVIRYVQAAGVAGARDELVVIHNNGAVLVEVTNWCLRNKANVLFVCFNATPEQEQIANGTFHYFLPAYGDMTIASIDHATGGMYNEFMYSFTYTVTNQSSGSLVNSADSISLVDENNEIVDGKTWTSTIQAGKALARMLLLPNIYAVGNDTTDWQTIGLIPFVESALQVEIRDRIPQDPEQNPEETTPEEPAEDTALLPFISELLPNPSGADAGKEFIELYNPSQEEIILDSFSLQIGESSPKYYSFPQGAKILPGQYLIFSDADLGYTLVNTTGFVQLLRNEIAAGDPVEYSGAKDDQSWALLDEGWLYTTATTPGGANTLPLEVEESETEAVADIKPCASDQYRNPETGRCKLVAVASTQPPCKEGQQRSPETNRCRSIMATSSEPAPCKAGQERNAETNRCRTVVKMTDADYGVKGVQQKAGAQLSWYYIVTIVLVVVGILTYGVWEWRHELVGVWRRIRKVFARREA